MSGLHDTDVVEWAEQQAGLLRRHAAGEKLNERPDWANIIEEVESVGRSELGSVESLWTQAFLYDLKAAAWPTSPDVPVWQGSARGFRARARRRYRPSMRSRLDLAGLCADALAGLPDTNDGVEPRPVSQACPATLDGLLAKKR